MPLVKKSDRARVRGLIVGGLVACLLLATGCASGPEPRTDTLSRHGLAMASDRVPTVEAVMVDGNAMEWAQKGILFFESGSFDMATPHFEAVLESGQTHPIHRVLIYWLNGISYQALGEHQDEIRNLELFVFAVDNMGPVQLEGQILVGRRGEAIGLNEARTQARAWLFAYRIERLAGFGSTQREAVAVESFDEENQVLTNLRCGLERDEHVELVDQKVFESNGRHFDRFDGKCSRSAEPLRVFFDITDVVDKKEERAP